MRRNALDRAVESFIAKYPEYKDAIRLIKWTGTVSFNGKLYRELANFKEYTPTREVTNWLGRCRLTDIKLMQVRDAREAQEKQGKLL